MSVMLTIQKYEKAELTHLVLYGLMNGMNCPGILGKMAGMIP